MPPPRKAALFYLCADGPYISYWGLDANGTPAMLVTDLKLVD